MAQYWTRRNDQDDMDTKTCSPWSEIVMKEDRANIRKTIHVVAAIIHDSKGRIFCTQRGYGEWKDWWEFPGGKIEQGETPQEALKREIREELDAEIEVGELFTTVEYDYPKFHLSMQCFMSVLASDSMKLLEHKDARWLTKEELDSFKWLPADEGIIEILKQTQN